MGLKNSKAKGSRNEYKTIRMLEAEGYACTKSAASLGVWDVIAIGNPDTLYSAVLVQVKSNKWPGSVEMKTLMEFRVGPGVMKLVHRWRNHQRKPDVRVL